MSIQKVISISDRVPNRVDDLLLRVDKFRKARTHDFRSLGLPELNKSLVEGTYIGSMAQGQLKVPSSKLQCIHCSLERTESIESMCPYCLGDMKEGQLHAYELDGMTSRARYFGSEYTYYAVRLRHCFNCNFTIACDEWNQ